MLGGSHPDKLDLAWHLSVYLQLAIQGGSSVYEWESGANTEGLIAAIRRESIDATASTDEESVKIFVLLNLDPQDAKLEDLKNLTDERRIFVIATTESPEEKWSLSQLERKSWLDSSAGW